MGTERYGLIGFPLGHSFSKDYFNEKFESEGIDAEYLNFELSSIGMLPEILKNNPDLKGLNVTIPYKEQIIPYLDELDPDARSMGAVNVVRIDRDHGKTKLTGFNTDLAGFTASIRPLLETHHRKALILGTGGAAKAVLRGLTSLGLESTLVSRTRQPGRLTYAELTPEIMKQHPVLVNCTPVGMFPHLESCPEIPYEFLTSNHLLFDLLYNPETTLFLEKGARKGASIKNGLEMLHLQARAAWEIWNGSPGPSSKQTPNV